MFKLRLKDIQDILYFITCFTHIYAKLLKENIFRFTPERQQVARKPYKTTINTANDTIQYKGFSSENLKKAGQNKYDKPVFGGGRRLESEHYKVPKNKVPVPAELSARRTRITWFVRLLMRSSVWKAHVPSRISVAKKLLKS